MRFFCKGVLLKWGITLKHKKIQMIDYKSMEWGVKFKKSVAPIKSNNFVYIYFSGMKGGGAVKECQVL